MYALFQQAWQVFVKIVKLKFCLKSPIWAIWQYKNLTYAKAYTEVFSRTTTPDATFVREKYVNSIFILLNTLARMHDAKRDLIAYQPKVHAYHSI